MYFQHSPQKCEEKIRENVVVYVVMLLSTKMNNKENNNRFLDGKFYCVCSDAKKLIVENFNCQSKQN